MRTAACLALALAFLGCEDDDDATCGDPLYLGDATDEVWFTMVDGDDDAIADSPNAPVLTDPAAGGPLSASGEGLRVAWTSPIAVQWKTPHGVRQSGEGGGWLSLFEGTAWAHLPPVTGDVYWVRLTVPGRACAIEAITTDLEWSLDAGSWDAVRSGSSVQIDLTSAYLNENRIHEGPYRAAPRTVPISP